MKLSRFETQIVSLSCMLAGLIFLIATDKFIIGIVLINFALWIISISESILLSKIELEMRTALNDLSKKNEDEVDKVLKFLKQSLIAASPFESINGAKKLCERLSTPSMILTANYQIIYANEEMHTLLEWEQNSLSNVQAHTINDPIIMSKVGEYASLPENQIKQSISARYVYITKSSKRLVGLMHAKKIGVEGFFVIFYPDDSLVYSF